MIVITVQFSEGRTPRSQGPSTLHCCTTCCLTRRSVAAAARSGPETGEEARRDASRRRAMRRDASASMNSSRDASWLNHSLFSTNGKLATQNRDRQAAARRRGEPRRSSSVHRDCSATSPLAWQPPFDSSTLHPRPLAMQYS